MSHTPGPWKYEDHKSNNSRFVTDYIIRSEEQYIADVHISIKPEIEQEGEANARLIAAAPEMLEALKLVAEFGCECHDEPERHPCMVCIANDAIARAEGRE